jgi:glycosyltransferase involved in cell wall biosynthesis
LIVIVKSELNIVHTESHRQWGGQERRIYNEARWMRMQGHRIIIVAPGSTPLFEKARQEGWERYALHFNKFGMIKDAFQLRAILRNVRPDILNTHGNTDSKVGLFAAWGLHIPCVIRTRHSTPPVSASWYNRLLYGKMCHFVFTTADCVSRQIREDLGVSENRIMTFPSGIDCPDQMIDHGEARRKLADEIGVQGDRRFIGFIGRLSSEKGLHVLIDAFAGIMDQVPDHHLVVIGDGDLVDDLQNQIRQRNGEDRIHLMGYRDDPWPYFRALDCFVLASSQFEGVPQAMLQAMFAGSPVIGTTVGGIPDIVRHDQTGLLVPPDTPDRLGEAILETLTRPDSALKRADNAYQYVSCNHTLAAMGRKIASLYEMHLSGARQTNAKI